MIPVNCGGPTVNVADPVTPANVADTVVAPWAVELASPEELIVAIPVGEELQVALALRSFVLPSLKVPLAENCWVRPRAIDGSAGETVIVVSEAGGAPTVSVVEPVMLAETAEIVVVPWAAEVAKPEAAIVATFVAEELQVAAEVRSFVLPSL